jgi:murein DD-endopeptidase MepM/ murein hydrolase activator NlpD
MSSRVPRVTHPVLILIAVCLVATPAPSAGSAVPEEGSSSAITEQEEPADPVHPDGLVVNTAPTSDQADARPAPAEAAKERSKQRETANQEPVDARLAAERSAAERAENRAAPNGAPALLHMPVEGWQSSAFGMRDDPYYGIRQLHAGMDIAAAGGTPIRAAQDGKVTRAGWSGGYGNYTCLSHGKHEGKHLSTCYAHQSEILVKVGERVKRGEIIGRVGTTGASTGDHLHFEVRLDGEPVDPAPLLPECLC